jgi:hypothetical protein
VLISPITGTKASLGTAIKFKLPVSSTVKISVFTDLIKLSNSPSTTAYNADISSLVIKRPASALKLNLPSTTTKLASSTEEIKFISPVDRESNCSSIASNLLGVDVKFSLAKSGLPQISSLTAFLYAVKSAKTAAADSAPLTYLTASAIAESV